MGTRWRWLGAVAFLGFFLICVAWSLAMPDEGVPDEQQHIVRAAGVVNGGLLPVPTAAFLGTGAYQPVPRGLVLESCWPFHPATPASCVNHQPTGDRDLVWMPDAVGRYHPLYYLAVGWPTRFWSGWSALILGRLCSAAISAGLLAAAVVAATRHSRHGVAVLGVFAAATPVALNLAGGINPNGMEIAAAIALFAALFPLVRGAGPVPRGLVHQSGLAAVALAWTRTPGPLWLAISAVAVLIMTPRSGLRRLWRERPVRWWLAAAALASVGSAAWTLAYRSNEVIAGSGPMTAWDALKLDATKNWWNDVVEAVGLLSWRDLPLPAPAYLLWLLVAYGLVAGGILAGRRRDRWAMAALTGLTFLAPSLVQAQSAPRYGIVMQGRYLLPMLTALPILAGYLVSGSPLPGAACRFMLRAGALILLPLHLMVLWYALIRFTHGLTDPVHLNPFWGSWHPLAGTATPFLVMGAGTAVVLALAWRVSRPHTDP